MGNFDKKFWFYGLFVVGFLLVLSGYFHNKEVSVSGPEMEKFGKIDQENTALKPNIEVQASEERLDRSKPNWLQKYCVERVKEIGSLPGKYERFRGPFVGLAPIYKSDRHVGYSQKSTCSQDFYIWSVRSEAFSSMGVDYAYSVDVWNQYYDVLTASKSAELVSQGWKEIDVDGKLGVKPDYSMMYNNRLEGLKEYLDVFYTNDEEVVYELLVVNTGGDR